MLKKLVKYGNSNALVLDKAILELLDIEEGSIVKIKTDGQAIIITAHQTSTSKEKITPVLTHNDVLKDASIKEMLKQYKHLDKAQKERFAEEFALYQSKLENSATTENSNILEDMTALSVKHGLPTPTEKQMADMQADFAEHFKKHAATQTKLAQVIHDPEYMHEMQLLSEKHINTQGDSAEYVKATRELLWKYIPEMRQADEEMAAISKKYESIK